MGERHRESYLINSIVDGPGKDHMCPLTGMSAITDGTGKEGKMPNLDIPAILDRMAEIGMYDLGLPMSLILDTWDACDIAGGGYIDRQTWMKALEAAIQAYEDNPVGYTWNQAIPRI